LEVGAIRGEDSTGLISVERDTTFHIQKEGSPACFFVPQVEDNHIEKAMWSTGKAYIGHNRKKTIGAVADATAHPFVVDDTFAMVHNGTLYGHEKLAATDVDSEALAIVLHKAFKEADYIPAVEDTLSKVFGAYAVAMYDQEVNCVRLLRNKERPLCVVETDNAWYFASEGLMLQWILHRNGYTFEQLKNLKLLKEDTLLTFDLDKNTVKEEGLSTKKYSPPATTHTGMVTGVNKELQYTGSKHTTRNEFKRLKKKYMFSTICYWVDDFVEANFPRTFEDGETVFHLMGEYDHIETNNIVHATIDITEHNVSYDQMTGCLWIGLVDNMIYDTKSGTANIYVSKTRPAASNKIIDADYIKNKLDDDEKAANQPQLH